MRDLDDPQKHAGPVAMPLHDDREWKPRTPCDVAGLVRPGVIASRPMAMFNSTAPGARRVPDVYGGIRPRVNVRSLLYGFETNRWNG
jgi:hypothetical protein